MIYLMSHLWQFYVRISQSSKSHGASHRSQEVWLGPVDIKLVLPYGVGSIYDAEDAVLVA